MIRQWSRHERLSRFLSYVLRHDPQAIGIELDAAGWADVEELVAAARRHGKQLERQTLVEIVERDEKRRYTLSADGQRIRANYGHSVPIRLALEPSRPPERLYHGTATRFLDSIMRQGLLPTGRQYVHLSLDVQTALQVGRRHGKPIVLVVDAGGMYADGFEFYCSAGGLWLVERVPVEYLRLAGG